MRRPRAPTLRAMRLAGDGSQRIVGELQLHILELEEPLILLDDGVLRLGKNLDQRGFVQIVEHADHRQASDELGDQAELDQVLRLRPAAASRYRAAAHGRRLSLPCLVTGRKPSDFLPMRRPIIFSSPTKAPPQMNRMFVVSTGVNSWCGCLRPPCGGTLATVPSRIFSSACCTPSPETSRVIDGFSSLRPILSISSI